MPAAPTTPPLSRSALGNKSTVGQLDGKNDQATVQVGAFNNAKTLQGNDGKADKNASFTGQFGVDNKVECRPDRQRQQRRQQGRDASVRLRQQGRDVAEFGRQRRQQQARPGRREQLRLALQVGGLQHRQDHPGLRPAAARVLRPRAASRTTRPPCSSATATSRPPIRAARSTARKPTGRQCFADCAVRRRQHGEDQAGQRQQRAGHVAGRHRQLAKTKQKNADDATTSMPR